MSKKYRTKNMVIKWKRKGFDGLFLFLFFSFLF